MIACVNCNQSFVGEDPCCEMPRPNELVTFRHHDWIFGEILETELRLVLDDNGELLGVIDDEDDSVDEVFNTGQCHSFAIALAQVIDSVCVLLVDPVGGSWHVGVIFGDDGWADVRGCHVWDEEEFVPAGLCAPTGEALLALLKMAQAADDDGIDWHPLQVEDATPFARAIAYRFGLL